MGRFIAVLPALFGSLAAANEVISRDTPVSVALLLGGIATSVGFAWWARGEKDRLDRIDKRTSAMKTRIDNLWCVRHGLGECRRNDDKLDVDSSNTLPVNRENGD